ncbi:MAG: hypothetical protein J6C03_01305 [Clostridia bacterium]|nr:hypothetical protein [Clostridia bacterium]
MKKFIKIEIRRIIDSKRFWLVLLIGCAITVSQYISNVLPCIQYMNIYEKKDFSMLMPFEWYSKWIGGEYYTLQSFLYFIVLPLLCVIPWGDSLYTDIKTGYTKNLFIRGKKGHYYAAKYISSFFSGGVIAVVPLLVNIMLSCATLPSLVPETAAGTNPIFSTSMWADLYYSFPDIYVILYMLIIFVYGGLFTLTSVTLGAFVENRFIVILMPFIVYLFSYTVLGSFGFAEYVPYYFLSPAQKVNGISLDIIVIEAMLLFLITGLVFIYKAKHDETL